MGGNNLISLFGTSKPIIGMIHLAGDTSERVTRALEELSIYEEEGVSGAIIEDYHGDPEDVRETLSKSVGFRIVRGVNVLRSPYLAFKLASDFGARFIQFDSVQTPDLDLELYSRLKREHPSIAVLGGIGFKYTEPTGNPLEVDLKEGREKCEVIVTTGSGTGIETPIEKLKEFRRLLGDFPLFVGAGVNLDNVREQLMVADGAIVGSYFKPDGDTCLPVDRLRVRDLMSVVQNLRK